MMLKLALVVALILTPEYSLARTYGCCGSYVRQMRAEREREFEMLRRESRMRFLAASPSDKRRIQASACIVWREWAIAENKADAECVAKQAAWDASWSFLIFWEPRPYCIVTGIEPPTCEGLVFDQP